MFQRYMLQHLKRVWYGWVNLREIAKRWTWLSWGRDCHLTERLIEFGQCRTAGPGLYERSAIGRLPRDAGEEGRHLLAVRSGWAKRSVCTSRGDGRYVNEHLREHTGGEATA